MCGIAGIWEWNHPANIQEEAVRQMGNAIVHRGPDDEGVWVDSVSGVGLAHRRLSIVDLSQAGHQPMSSHCGNWVIAFNGEIYNHKDIKLKLEAIRSRRWNGHSDTEVLLEAIAELGIDEALRLAVGMFAFALWDKQSQELYIVRDRIGEKPLYYFDREDKFIFGSELSCIEAVVDLNELSVNRFSLSQLIRKGFISAPNSIYTQVYKLSPGSYIKVSKGTSQEVKYWQISELVGHQNNATYEENLAELEELISQSIGGQMLADVSVGAFLSGGVDSSTVVALMQKQSKKPIKTYSIGFRDAAFNEAEFAAKIAQNLGTEHAELYVSQEDLLEAVSEIPNVFSEPFGDSSQLPMLLVAKMAKEHVTVCLSGDGGDELFSGYRRYGLTLQAWHKLNKLPLSVRKAGKVFFRAIPTRLLNSFGSLMNQPMLGDKLKKAAEIIDIADFSEFYRSYLMASYRGADDLVIGGDQGDHDVFSSGALKTQIKHQDLMTTYDLLDYLPDDILCKVDRCAMGVSLEGRIPLLDHRIVEHALKMPHEQKVKGNVSKSPLRDILYKYVPRDLIERPKKGFAVPLAGWLRNELKPWAESLLDLSEIEAEGFFDAELVETLWSEHQSGARNWSGVLWNVLMFQQWLESRKKHKAGL
ncbi:asparagine synthase (glutamine-hydrolyzing) [Pseudoalteromonas piscicida]|uniref:asparagine synthase (glutamine-hydrolyzing) n=1 Tax=Pseudoalteromonas piscicida TaxID=43662 RepID=A0A2A5JVW6_PSEO7|nr:asparagine synthase (glutamine-hydrolyzing) [Pseudoalteromonas piscicida]PCK33604.1 asparagine synthase (glutamine-hydrolyzing) [Pseudoalteromonas piscicida]